jgi:phenylacetate-coenzyme A ligase PaaK-like adenylate-forming protein
MAADGPDELVCVEAVCASVLPLDDAGPEKVAALVEQKAAALGSYVRRHVPFYEGLPEQPTLDDFPVVDKADLMLGLPGTTAEPDLTLEELRSWVPTDERDGGYVLFRDRYYVRRTSGTTGVVGFFLWDVPSALAARAAQSRFLPYLDDLPRPLVAVSPVVALPRYAGVLQDMHAVPMSAGLDGTVELLNRLQPRSVIGSPAFTASVAEEQLAGRLHIRPEMVMVWTERCLPHQRRSIMDAWGVDPGEPYGTSETSGIAIRCTEGNFHVLADHVHLELLDASGRPVKVGEVSERVVVTRLCGPRQPIIRYELGDVVVRGPDVCACGQPFPTLSEIHGRARSRLWLESLTGEPIDITAFLLVPVLEDAPGVVRYQLRYDEPGQLEVAVVTRGAFDGARVVDRLTQVINEAGAVAPEITLVPGELPSVWAAPPGSKDHHVRLGVDERSMAAWLAQRTSTA